MANYRVISSDNHVFEPPDLWTSRAKPAFRDRVPQLVREYDGDWWFCDGHRTIGLAAGAQTGMRFETPEQLVRTTTFDKVRRGGYDPAEHVKDMDADDVDVSIVYPTVGLLLYSVPDTALLSEIFRNYNDWLAEFSAGEPKRLKGIAMINVDDVQEGVKELERCAKMGLAGGMITVYPPEGKGYDNPMYEPLWAAAQDLDIPLGMHIATNRPGPGQDFGLEDRNRVRNSFLANADHWVRMSLADMIFSGVFERHPKLQVVPSSTNYRGFRTSSTASTTPTPNGSSRSAIASRKPCCRATISTGTCLPASRKTRWAYAIAMSSVSTISSGAPIIRMSNPPSPEAIKSSRIF
jgi:predicted TIM-barrel fold metal-dependent hydrolase